MIAEMRVELHCEAGHTWLGELRWVPDRRVSVGRWAILRPACPACVEAKAAKRIESKARARVLLRELEGVS